MRVADPRDAYAYADDAWDFGDAIYDAPPDYGFDYAGVEPWAWEGYDQSLTFVEPIDDGYRYYYYQPGADEPYFVRDPDYGYGYDNGQLAVIYGPGGAILPYDSYGPRIDYASRYLARGRDLYAVSRERGRQSVNAASWAARAATISAAQSRWASERARQSAWRDYHQRVAAEATRHWQPERTRRQADAQRFATWQRSDYRAAPPPRVIPAAWQQARWAQDDHRYVALPARQSAAPLRVAGAGQPRPPDQAVPQQVEQQRAFGHPQQAAAAAAAAAAVAAVAIKHQQQRALVQQQAGAHQAQQRAAEMAHTQADRAMRQATAGQKRMMLQPQLNPQRQQAQVQAQAREAQHMQLQAHQAQAGALRAQAQAGAREQARAAQAARAGQARAQAQVQAAGQARARAEQQAHAQAVRGQAEALGRARAQAAQAQAQAHVQAARVQAQAARAQIHAAPPPRAQPAAHPPAAAPRPAAAPPQHGGAPGHGRHPG